jgi:hypothetical protein
MQVLKRGIDGGEGLDPALPYLKRQSVEALTRPYNTTNEGVSGIASSLNDSIAPTTQTFTHRSAQPSTPLLRKCSASDPVALPDSEEQARTLALQSLSSGIAALQ